MTASKQSRYSNRNCLNLLLKKTIRVGLVRGTRERGGEESVRLKRSSQFLLVFALDHNFGLSTVLIALKKEAISEPHTKQRCPSTTSNKQSSKYSHASSSASLHPTKSQPELPRSSVPFLLFFCAYMCTISLSAYIRYKET